MEIFKCISGRRSIRKYTSENIDDKTIERLIDAARMAPSAGNIQDWFFVIVRDPQLKEELARAAYNQMFIATAPVIIVYFADLERIARGYGERGRTLYALQDSGAAIQNLLLAAHALGLGTCWIGAFDERRTESLLNAPKHLRAVAIIPVGHPAEAPAMRQRRPRAKITAFDKLG